MDLKVEHSCKSILRIIGELDYINSSEIYNLIQDAFENNDGILFLALDAIDYIDSSGLNMLIDAAHYAQERGYTLKIISLTADLANMIGNSDTSDLFNIEAIPADTQSNGSSSCYTDGTYCTTIPAARYSCREARVKVSNFAGKIGYGDEEIDDIMLAVGEALSNAVRHGAKESDKISVICDAEPGQLAITIRYPSEAFDPDTIPVPNTDCPTEGGMGIHFMRLVMDSVEYRFDSGNAVVTLIKRSLPKE